MAMSNNQMVLYKPNPTINLVLSQPWMKKPLFWWFSEPPRPRDFWNNGGHQKPTVFSNWTMIQPVENSGALTYWRLGMEEWDDYENS